MRMKKSLFRILSMLLLLCILPIGAYALPNPPSQAGDRVIEGGQRDFLWPVPGNYNLTSCYLDNRSHYSLDMDGEMGDPVVASYEGKVIGINTENGTTGWGNYVLLEHNYKTKSGSQIVLYSRYAHLKDVLVAVGDTVTAGQKIGTVGATGSVNTSTGDGSHLDYDILYGGTDKANSVDPYINELLELPSAIYTTSGKCCQEYVAYIKEFYGTCTHKTFDAEGFCTECGDSFDWNATKNVSKQGYYSAVEATEVYKKPYKTADSLKVLSAGEETAVNGTVTNSAKETWYEVQTENGAIGYIPKAALKFESSFEAEITGELTTLTEGQVLEPNPHRLDGTITSRYPLKKVVGYLDGKWCGSWYGDGKTRELALYTTNINSYVSFGKLATGKHTIVITASDSTGLEIEVITCTFYIARQTDILTVTFETEMQDCQPITLIAGEPLGELPELQLDGGSFLGWFTKPQGGEMVTAETVPTESITLYPQWDMTEYTVTFGEKSLVVSHGACITDMPRFTKNGYIVSGWFTAEGEEITETTPITSDMVLYPEWEPMQYILTLDPRGGSVAESQIVVYYGEPYGALPIPTREGYEFQGWRLGGMILTSSSIVEIMEDHTAVAVWGEAETPAFWLIPVVLVVLAALAFGWFYMNRLWMKRAIEEDWE